MIIIKFKGFIQTKRKTTKYEVSNQVISISFQDTYKSDLTCHNVIKLNQLKFFVQYYSSYLNDFTGIIKKGSQNGCQKTGTKP